MPLQLPGFYWDNSKNRYFPLSVKPRPPPTPLPLPTSLPQSPTFVRRWEVAKTTFSHQQRSRIRHDTIASQYARTSSTKEHRLPVIGAIKNFVTTTTSLGHTYRLIGDSNGWIYVYRDFQDHDEETEDHHYMYNQWITDINIHSESEISSIHIVDSYSLATTFGPVSRMRLQNINEPNNSVIITAPEFHDIRCSHFTTPNEIIIGAKNCLGLLQNVSSSSNPTTKILKTHSDVFSLSKHHSLIYAGTRNGTIHRFDLRTPQQTSTSDRGFKTLFTTASHKHGTVINTEIVNDIQFLASYMSGELVLYDIRYVRQDTPILKFEGHVNSYTQRLGLAIDYDENYLFAAGQDKRIRAWSLLSGNPLIPPSSSSFSSASIPLVNQNQDQDHDSPIITNRNPLQIVFDHMIETLQVSRDNEKGSSGLGPPCLWAGMHKKLYQFELGRRV